MTSEFAARQHTSYALFGLLAVHENANEHQFIRNDLQAGGIDVIDRANRVHVHNTAHGRDRKGRETPCIGKIKDSQFDVAIEAIVALGEVLIVDADAGFADESAGRPAFGAGVSAQEKNSSSEENLPAHSDTMPVASERFGTVRSTHPRLARRCGSTSFPHRKMPLDLFVRNRFSSWIIRWFDRTAL